MSRLAVLVVIVLVVLAWLGGSSCLNECSSYGDCPDGEYCSAGTCVEAPALPDAGPRPLPDDPDAGDDGGSGDGGDDDAGALDAGAVDAGAGDAGAIDAGAVDAGPIDAGPIDAGPPPFGPFAAMPMCTYPCTGPDDCVVRSGAPFDADNYLCVDGGCLYLGCRSDAECAAQGDNNTICQASNNVPVCVPECDVAADCVEADAGTASSDQDNLACESGRCSFLGCQNDEECAALWGLPVSEIVCHEPNAGVPYCTARCITPTDCAADGEAAHDEDNYQCHGGACVYLGCNSSAECSDEALLDVCVAMP